MQIAIGEIDKQDVSVIFLQFLSTYKEKGHSPVLLPKMSCTYQYLCCKLSHVCCI